MARGCVRMLQTNPRGISRNFEIAFLKTLMKCKHIDVDHAIRGHRKEIHHETRSPTALGYEKLCLRGLTDFIFFDAKGGDFQ